MPQRISQRPVSYTHLDVYKRQDEAAAVKASIEQAAAEIAQEFKASDPDLKLTVSEAVSYTHLLMKLEQIVFSHAV